MHGNNSLRDETLDFFLEQAPIMGQIALSHFGNLSKEDTQDKVGHIHDPVTIADTEISNYIVPLVKRVYNDRALLLTEESANCFQQELLRTGKPLLIVDELDGTKNFKEGKEHLSVLFGLAELTPNGYEMTVGVVYKPLTGEFYFATIDSDATYRSKDGLERKLGVSGRDKIISEKTPVNVTIGRETFPVDYPEEFYRVTEIMENFRDMNSEQVENHSKLSCGLEIMDIVRGNVDVFLCAKAANWDYAGASLILRQAGGKSYLAKSVDMLTNPQPWSLQLDLPGNYYSAFFTNGKIDQSFFKRIQRYKPK